MTDGLSPEMQKQERNVLAASQASRIASQLSPDALIPVAKEESQKYREKLVQALAKLVVRLKEYLKECDTIVIDELGAHLPGVLVADLAKAVRKELGLSPPFVHYIVGSRALEDGQVKREQFIRKAYERGEMGAHVLVVTEHVRSGETVVLLADLIKEVAYQSGKTIPEVRMASVSVASKFPRQVEKTGYPWHWGTDEDAIGSAAFSKKTSESNVSYSSHSASPHKVRAEESAGNVAYEDMRMLARELLPLVLAKKSK